MDGGLIYWNIIVWLRIFPIFIMIPVKGALNTLKTHFRLFWEVNHEKWKKLNCFWLCIRGIFIVGCPFIRTKGPKIQCFLPPILWVSTAEGRRSDQKFEKNSSYLIFRRERMCVLYLKKKWILRSFGMQGAFGPSMSVRGEEPLTTQLFDNCIFYLSTASCPVNSVPL